MLIKIIIMIIYIGVIGYLGFLGYKNTKSNRDYLIAGRKIHPMIMALSYGATFISTSAIVGFGGNAGVFGMGLLWLTFMNIFFGIFIAFLVFGKRTRKIGHNMEAHTFPEFLGKRFQSRLIQKFSGWVVFIFMPVYAAAVMIGAAKIIESSLGIEYNAALFTFAIIVAAYVFFGGLKGVMYSDAFQGSIMFLGMLTLVIWVYAKLGGVTSAHQQLTDLFSNPAIADQIKGLVAGGFQGWTSMPEMFSQYWWIVVSTLVLGVGIGVLAQPQLAVRFMTVKSDRELNRAISAGGVFILMMTGVAFTVGALSNVLFFQETGKIAVASAGGTDNIIPVFMDSFMPPWFSATFLVVLIAAGMSTLSSQFHAIGTAVGRDLFDTSRKSDKVAMLISRLGVFIGILVTVFLAYTLPAVWDGAIAISTVLFFGVCAASFLPVYFGALYIRKLSRKAAVSGMLSGFSVSMLWMMFIHSKEATVLGVSQLLFGRPFLFDSAIQFVNPVIVSLLTSIVVTVVVGVLTRPDVEESHLRECFKGLS
ncbi:MAG: sodium:solute symporter family protein [Clostridia bacterium]